MNISILQFDIAFENVEENRAKIIEMIESVPEETDVVVMPEMWNTSFNFKSFEKNADIYGEPTKSILSGLAKKKNVNIIAGSIADREDDKIYNRVYVFNRFGEVVYKYDKIHLIHHAPEDKYITPGNQVQCFELDGVSCGVVLCYDLRFPELTRTLALEGAKVIFAVVQWFESRIVHWDILMKARALENEVYFVGANRVGSEYKAVFPGKSMIVNPWGEVLDQLDNQESILSQKIDLALIDRVRKKIPCHGDRRPDIYRV